MSLGAEPRVASSAEIALRELDSLRSPRADSHLVSIREFAHSLRSGLHFIDPALTVTTALDDSPERPILPVAAARDLSAAATEALRNSVAHARGHRRSATVSYLRPTGGADRGHEVRVVIEDDGPGYDLRTVPPHRMGTRASIVGRMDALPGGGASIETAPGVGVRVTLVWTAT